MPINVQSSPTATTSAYASYAGARGQTRNRFLYGQLRDEQRTREREDRQDFGREMQDSARVIQSEQEEDAFRREWNLREQRTASENAQKDARRLEYERAITALKDAKDPNDPSQTITPEMYNQGLATVQKRYSDVAGVEFERARKESQKPPMWTSPYGTEHHLPMGKDGKPDYAEAQKRWEDRRAKLFDMALEKTRNPDTEAYEPYKAKELVEKLMGGAPAPDTEAPASTETPETATAAARAASASATAGMPDHPQPEPVAVEPPTPEQEAEFNEFLKANADKPVGEIIADAKKRDLPLAHQNQLATMIATAGGISLPDDAERQQGAQLVSRIKDLQKEIIAMKGDKLNTRGIGDWAADEVYGSDNIWREQVGDDAGLDVLIALLEKKGTYYAMPKALGGSPFSVLKPLVGKGASARDLTALRGPKEAFHLWWKHIGSQLKPEIGERIKKLAEELGIVPTKTDLESFV